MNEVEDVWGGQAVPQGTLCWWVWSRAARSWRDTKRWDTKDWDDAEDFWVEVEDA